MLCFQAEDGIRDLVRSRGLGDVYKRQGLTKWEQRDPKAEWTAKWWFADAATLRANDFNLSVSYTHLTLPTSDLV